MSAPIGAAYSANQLQRALDAAARGEPARERVRRWRAVVAGLASGQLSVGTRTPVARYPEWVTLEVVTGGFATGAAPAAGPLLPHETAWLDELGLHGAEFPRLALNRYFLSDAGSARLLRAVASHHAVIELAEEAALPTVAWLAAQGHADLASELVSTLAPFAHELRFYPRLDASEPPGDDQVRLESAGRVVERLRSMRLNPRVLAQREAIGTWTPLYDQAVALVLDTIEGAMPVAERDAEGGWQRNERGQWLVHGGWPFRCLSDDWAARARALVDTVEQSRSQHTSCKRFSRSGEPFTVLVSALDMAANAPQRLTGRDVGRVRLIVARAVAKRGEPGSATARADRHRQHPHATAKTHQELAQDVAARLAACPPLAGLDTLDAVLPAPSGEGAAAVPPGVLRRLQRCLNGSPEDLVDRGVVTSAEVLAALLPQRTSQLRAARFRDEPLRTLYAATYRAFRRRRSLLLLDLQKQVQIEALPWVAAMERFRESDQTAARSAATALGEFASIAVTRFPQTMLPNKLLKEFDALARQAGKSLPFTEELAADIFMGQFSPKFVEAAALAAVHLRDTLYARYYRVDYQDLAQRLSAARTDRDAAGALAALCAERAGETLGTWRAASNGRIIEQQLIVTSHNLAGIAELEGVRERLAGHTAELSEACFTWALRHLQLPLGTGEWRVELHRIKNAAHAWRQMVFLVSLSPSDAPAFLARADALLNQQPPAFAQRFRPALAGLRMAVVAPDRWLADTAQSPFLGWRDTERWRSPGR